MKKTLESEVLSAIQELKAKLKDEILLTGADFEILIIASMLEELQNEHK